MIDSLGFSMVQLLKGKYSLKVVYNSDYILTHLMVLWLIFVAYAYWIIFAINYVGFLKK